MNTRTRLIALLTPIAIIAALLIAISVSLTARTIVKIWTEEIAHREAALGKN